MKFRKGQMSLEDFKQTIPSSTTLKRWGETGDDAKILVIIGLVFDNWRRRSDSAVTSVSWLHNLRGLPLPSIYGAYKFYRENPTEFRPDPGSFRAKVLSHAKQTQSLTFYANEKGQGA
jgi:hypothetical protein